jgi:hypothetical protein
MHGLNPRWLPVLLCLVCVTGCNALTDPATRLASGIEAGVSQLGMQDGATYSIQNLTPATSGECNGPYTVQLDKVGALIVWCKDAAGKTLISGSTTYHARFVDTPKTYIVNKSAGSSLTIDLQRRNGRAVIVDVR